MKKDRSPKKKGLDLSRYNVGRGSGFERGEKGVSFLPWLSSEKIAPSPWDRIIEGEEGKPSSPRLFKLAKPPIGYGPLLVFVVIFFILINIFNVFLTITLSFIIGALFYFGNKKNRARRLAEKGIEEALYGDKELAVELFKKALVLDPKNYPVLYLTGYTLATGKRFTEAIPYLERFLDVNYDYDTVLLLARSYREVGKIDEAIELLETIPETSARYPQGIILLTKSYLEKGVLDKAEKAAERGIENIPLKRKKARTDLRILLGKIYEMKGKLKEALAQYEALLLEESSSTQISLKIEEIKKKLESQSI